MSFISLMNFERLWFFGSSRWDWTLRLFLLAEQLPPLWNIPLLNPLCLSFHDPASLSAPHKGRDTILQPSPQVCIWLSNHSKHPADDSTDESRHHGLKAHSQLMQARFRGSLCMFWKNKKQKQNIKGPDVGFFYPHKKKHKMKWAIFIWSNKMRLFLSEVAY